VAIVDNFERQAVDLPRPMNAGVLIDTEPPPPDQILADTFDLGDKVAIIGSSKLRKSFLLLQFLLSVAAGRDFLSFRVPKARRVLHIQFEIQGNHFHRRVRRMAKALGIKSADLGDRFQVINARGLVI
jgi:RecA-family ATPase